jgi:hypothetical protein
MIVRAGVGFPPADNGLFESIESIEAIKKEIQRRAELAQATQRPGLLGATRPLWPRCTS